MSFTCWQGLGFPTLDASQTVLKAFDGHMFSPHGILVAFPIELGEKIVTIEVEVVNVPLDYNLLLGRSWFLSHASGRLYRVPTSPFSPPGEDCFHRPVGLLFSQCSI